MHAKPIFEFQFSFGRHFRSNLKFHLSYKHLWNACRNSIAPLIKWLNKKFHCQIVILIPPNLISVKIIEYLSFDEWRGFVYLLEDEKCYES